MLDQDTDYERLARDDILTPEAREFLPERTKLWVRCGLYEDVRAAAVKACIEGFNGMPGYLFFFFYFASIFEERNLQGFKRLPFIPYKYQIRELAALHALIQAGVGMMGVQGMILWLKSRDMGMTWLVLIYFLWDWLFNGGIYHVGSRKEEEVDKLGDPGTLFGKLRMALYALPDYMLPSGLVDKFLVLSYADGESAITGESANPNFGRGKRKKGALMDEFQAWEHDRAAVKSMSNTTNSLLLLGTPEGFGNYYSEVARGKVKHGQDVRKVHWTDHPMKARDLEIRSGKAWSPWYQGKVDKFPAQMIASELDLSFENSIKGPVFGAIYGLGHQKRGLKPVHGYPITRCWDPGGDYFAVMFIQVITVAGKKRTMVLREIATEGARLDEVADQVLAYSESLAKSGFVIQDKSVKKWSDWFEFHDPGDPSGATVSKANQLVPEYDDLFIKHKILVDFLFMAAMPTKLRVRARILSITNAMQTHISTNDPATDGPAFWVDIDECPLLDEALRGGYRRKTDISGNVMDEIEKRHPYNDVVDALGYGCVYELGIPEQIKREHQARSQEKEEDEEGDELAGSGQRRRRC